MRITSKGQVTIPQAIREQAGLLPNTEVEFRIDGDLVFLVRAGRAKAPSRGELLVEHLRRHRGQFAMTTDELHGAHAGRGLSGVLVDSNVLIDVLGQDPTWEPWSADALRHASDEAPLVINPIVYGEISLGYGTIEALDAALDVHQLRREGDPVGSRLPGGPGIPVLPGARRDAPFRAAGLLHRRPCSRRRLPAPHAGSGALPDVVPAARDHRAGLSALGRERAMALPIR